MYRFRTFTRSRTPTGAEMKTQSSLEVPKQVRSASFDEIKLEAQKAAALASLASHAAASGGGGADAADAGANAGLLQVPSHSGQRSHSFDSAGIQHATEDASNSFLDVPRRFQRRRSSTKTPPLCVHCMYMEEYKKRVGVQERVFFDQQEVQRHYESDTLSESSEEDDEDDESEGLLYANENTLKPPPSPHHGIVFTLSPTSNAPAEPFPEVEPASATGTASPPLSPGTPPNYPPSPTIELPPGCDELPGGRQRRRSISRQEAIFVEPTGNSLENVSATEAAKKLQSEDAFAKVQSDPSVDCVVSEIFLAVPDLKRDRAASVDSCFSKVSQAKTEELKPPEDGLTLTVPSNGALRSRSVDIVLPTEQQKRYKALALTQAMANFR